MSKKSGKSVDINPSEPEKDLETIQRELEENKILKEEESKVDIEIGKKLYDYQEADMIQIFERFENCPANYNLIYQLPTGGGKTVIFSEIARRYIKQKKKKVLILTHRIELLRQTSGMLSEFGVTNKVINSQVKELEDQGDYMCFVAMVETLNNRIQDGKMDLEEIGLMIVDEAHYNSFRKLFKYFEHCFILGVTATPLSSNIKLPMKDIYDELITGTTITGLIEKGFLARANTYVYSVNGLTSLKVGINGDYTVSSSEVFYSSNVMQGKLLGAYEERAKGKKVLIFNNGINTSKQVFVTFASKGYKIRHLDSNTPKQARKDILLWFKATPDAILTSVGILTTGFDEPSINTIIMNRATKSPTLYYQMIGRGSRIFKNKSTFDVIDLGNNVARFGLWEADVNWQKIFRSPQYYLDSIISDDDIERGIRYEMPDSIRKEFSKTENVKFDIEEVATEVAKAGLKTEVVIDRSIEQHVQMIKENATDFAHSLVLIRLLSDDIDDRVRRYTYQLSKSTKNFFKWAVDDYKTRLKRGVMKKF